MYIRYTACSDACVACVQSAERLGFKFDRATLMDPSEMIALHAFMASERDHQQQQQQQRRSFQ